MSDHSSPPRENLIRAVMPGVQIRAAADGSGDGSTLFGYFSRSNEWTEIASAWEGNFMERFAPGAHKKTLREGRDKMRVLFQHGQDPQVGDKPIAEIRDIGEDDQGAYYEARLFEGLPPLIMAGLRAGQYGASFRFAVVREQWDEDPGASEHNPKGLPERTVKEARDAEFGPVTFPAYTGATAGVRSLTDDFLMRCFAEDPTKLRAMFEKATSLTGQEERMDSEDVGTLAEMLALASSYIDEQDEEDAAELAAVTAMQTIQADLIKLLNVEAVEDEPDEPEDERSLPGQDPAPSSTDAALTRTSETERRDQTSRHGPLVLPTRTSQAGLSLTTERTASWPLR